MIPVTRATVLSYIFPQKFVNVDAVRDVSIEEFSDTYTWVQDDWNGLKDVITPVNETLEIEEGDCDDYAAVAASWAIENNREPVSFAYYFDGYRPRHVVAVDNNRVYSSGSVVETSIEDHITESEYDWYIARTIEGS